MRADVLPVSLRCVVSVNIRDKFQQSLPICEWLPLFSSSTVWWILPKCNRDRYAQCRTVHIGQQIIEIPLSPFVFGGRCPRYAGRAVSQVPPWRRHSCSHSCSSLRNCRPWFRLRKTAGFPQLQFIKVVHIPVVVQRPIMEIPQLQFDKGSSSLLCRLCSSTGAGCGGDSRDPSVASCSSPSCR